MQCPSCQHTDSRVLESRSADSGRSVRRRRECLHCEFRFTTYERVETVPITVLKRTGSRRPSIAASSCMDCSAPAKTGLDQPDSKPWSTSWSYSCRAAAAAR